MKYQIVQNSSVDSLVKSVERFLKRGWIPLGGMTYQPSNLSDYALYSQTMMHPRLHRES